MTDSAAALPVAISDAFGVHVVALRIDVEPPGGRVSTAAPSPGDFEAAIRAQLDAGADAVVVLTVAASMSATHQAAAVGARELGACCRVIDTATAAGAQALVVVAAAEAAERGACLEEVVRTAEAVAARVRLVAMVPDLSHLVRSGRVPGLVGRAGSVLGVHPLFELRAGSVKPLSPARSVDAAYERMLARVERSRVPGARGRVAVLHASAPSEADLLCARLRRD
ncbi:MAG: DegV family protein, partial [Acidimicrobiia bacterium]